MSDRRAGWTCSRRRQPEPSSNNRLRPHGTASQPLRTRGCRQYTAGMKSRVLSHLILVALSVGALALAACSSSDSDGGSGGAGATGGIGSLPVGGSGGMGALPAGGSAGSSEPVCAGTARQCTMLEQFDCISAEGCEWTDLCRGVAEPCLVLGEVQCSAQPGCYLSAEGPPRTNHCSNGGEACASNTECCVGDNPGGACVYTGHGTLCSPSCSAHDDCESGCCKNNICARSESCGGFCGAPGSGCDTGDDCCAGAECLDFRGNGSGLCAANCVTNADCKGGCCRKTTSGTSVCAPLALCE